MEEVEFLKLLRKLPKIKSVLKGHTKIEIRNIAKQLRKKNWSKCINNFRKRKEKIN